jgi:predicted NBD/HSP70 family sugar kinase
VTGPNGGTREFNRSRVLNALRAGRASSRGELGVVTGLSRGTVTVCVAELLAEGALVEGDDPSAGRQPGRPARRLQLAPRTDLVVAVDLGHSHCRVGIVDAAGAVLLEDNTALDVDSSADETLTHAQQVIVRLMTQVNGGHSRISAGALGLPAPVDVTTGSVGPGNVLPRWVDRRPAEELQAAIGIPFAVDNDANLGALAEATYGVARGMHDLIYVKASTGIGAGFLLGGRIHRGSSGRAGEIGHVPVDPNGPVCRCGNRGCLETVASVRQVLQALQPRYEGQLTIGRVVELVADADPGAVRVVSDAGRMIGRVLADAVNNLNPEIVAIGGELAAAGEPLLSGVCESIERYAQPGIARDLHIKLGALGVHSELLGAAALALA